MNIVGPTVLLYHGWQVFFSLNTWSTLYVCGTTLRPAALGLGEAGAETSGLVQPGSKLQALFLKHERV